MGVVLLIGDCSAWRLALLAGLIPHPRLVCGRWIERRTCSVLCAGGKSAMTDFHHNIFYYYRGTKQSSQDRARQLENNTTKALINTLEHCNSKVALDFLDWLGIEAGGKVEFELQKATISGGEIGNKPQRLLLGLVPSKRDEGNLVSKLAGPVTKGSIPDAWIYGDDCVVLIESKTKGSLEWDQMRSHFQKLQVGAKQQPRCKVQTWAEVHQFFVEMSPKLNGQDEWIVKQFTQYLEEIGMAEFTGFEQEVFDYFNTHDDEDVRQMVRGTMLAFAAKIQGKLRGEGQAFDDLFWYDDYHPGILHLEDDHCWVAFFGPGNREFRKYAHQTVSVYADRLDVFVNVELKDAIDRLRKKVRNEKQKFVEIVTALPEPFTVRMMERLQKVAMNYDYYEIANLEAGVYKEPHSGPYGLKDPESDGFDYIETLLKQIDLPYLSVRKRIDRKKALDLSEGNGDALVNEVVSIMKAFHPLVEFINT